MNCDALLLFFCVKQEKYDALEIITLFDFLEHDLHVLFSL